MNTPSEGPDTAVNQADGDDGVPDGGVAEGVPPVGRRETLHTRIQSDFSYHPPRDPGQQEKYSNIRAQCRELAHMLAKSVPPGRELSTALTKLEECMMHANAGIARHG